ncbi:MAG: pseudouridine synthase [Bdellovibrionales bacterium]
MKKTNNSKNSSNKQSSNRNKSTNSTTIRLNKYIAMTGEYSRRKADELVRFGKVRINGKTIREPGVQINPATDSVFVRNQPIKPTKDLVYIIFNKPPNVVSSMNDPEGRPSLKSYFERVRLRLIPVGRLDWDAEGLLILTTDGTFAQEVTHTKNEVPKTYLVKLNGQPSAEQLSKLTRGISIIGGKTKALLAQKMESRGSDKYDWVKLIINDSSNRQIRYMFEKIGFDVKKLKRIGIGALKLASLEKGKFKILSPDDVQKVLLMPKEIREDEKIKGPLPSPA